MKKYFAILASASLLFAACAQKEGTTPGSDSTPKVTVYQYNPGDDYNPDNDVAIKVTGNSKVSEIYYLVEKAEDYKANFESKAEKGYADYVVSTGTKLDLETSEFDSTKNGKVILTDLAGENIIAVVGKAGSELALTTSSFTGLSWTDLATGTFSSAAMASIKFPGADAISTKLQSCDQIEGRYRFPDLYTEGSHYVFELTGKEQVDGDGEKFFNVVVNPQATGITYGSYGDIMVRDVATWQGNSSYLEYNVFYPKDNYFLAWAEYYISAGYLGYDNDEFIPDGE